MAYSKRVATCIIGQDGRIFDEDPKGGIAVPFDSEFKIRIINKNEKKIGFDVFIDGIKVTKTGRIIVNAHDRIDLERYIENDDKGTKFRFVPKDSEEAKMEGKDKEPFTGVVEVRAYFEKERPREIIREVVREYPIYIEKWRGPFWNGIYYHYNHTTGYSGFSGCSGNAGFTGTTGSAGSYNMLGSTGSKNYSANVYNCSSNLEEGAVVKGSLSNQSFTSTYVDLEEDYISLKMYLMGYHTSEAIRQAVEKIAEKEEKQMEFDFMKDTKYVTKFCRGCGNKVSKDDNFCGKCGGKL